jgi:hypothetical protein
MLIAAIHLNGRYEIELQPQDDIDRSVLKEMTKQADMGRKLFFKALAQSDNSENYVMGVDKA